MNQTASLFEKAQHYHEIGQLKQAEPLYLTFLKDNPQHEEALFWLASLYTNLGRHQDAVDYYYRALELNPDAVETHTGLGMALNVLGQPVDAETSFRKALALDSNIAELHYYLGSALFQQAKFLAAESEFRRAIELKPGFLEAIINLRETLTKRDMSEEAQELEIQIAALQPKPKTQNAERASVKNVGTRSSQGRAVTAGTYIKEGDKLIFAKRYNQAAGVFQKAVQLDPNSYLANNGLASALMYMERSEESIPYFERTLALKPDYEPALVNLGNVLLGFKEAKRSEECHRKAVALNHSPVNLVNLAAALVLLRQYDEAIALCREALTARSNFGGAYLNMSIVLMELGRFEEAYEAAQKAGQHSPNEPEVYFLLNSINQRRRKEDESLAAMQKMLRKDPKNPRAHSEMGMLQLLLGNFEQGWPDYNSTYVVSGSAQRRFKRPEWKGEMRPDATLLLHIDQGVGDCIQFMRYLPGVKKRVGRIIMECRENTLPFFEHHPDIAQIVMHREDGSLPDDLYFDLHITTTYLPGLFWNEMGHVTESVPYLHAEAERMKRWQAQFADDKGCKVGLVWAGNPDYVNDHIRSTHLSAFAPLADVEGVSLYSLQKGPPAAEAASPPSGMKIVDLAEELTDFYETEAAIASLDLVISVDTSVAHLAGAMNCPIWTLLPFVYEWRWMRDRTDTPWYPSMRLFRQENYGDWEGLLQTAADALKAHIGK